MSPTVVLLLKALALVFVIEGIMPFAMPEKWRSMILRICHQPTKSIQLFGLTCMLFGLVVLCLLHWLF